MIEPVTAEEMVEGFEELSHSPVFQPKKAAEEIIDEFANKSGFDFDELCSASRARDIVHVRQDCMLAIRKQTGMKLSAIGWLFNRDHTTVHYSIQQAQYRADRAAK